MATDERWTDIDLPAAFSRASQPIFLLNERGALVFANPALHELFQIPVGNRVCWRELETGPLKPPHDLPMEGASQLDVRLPNGEWMQVVFHSLNDSTSGRIAILGVLRPVAKTAAAAVSDVNLFARWERLREDQRLRYGFDVCPARSQAGSKLLHQLKIAVSVDSPVMFLGESGVGKRTLARAIHHQSRDRGWSATLDAEGLSVEEQSEFLFGEGGALTQSGPGRLILRRPLLVSWEVQKALVEAQESAGREWRLLATEREPLETALADGKLHPPFYHLLTRHVIPVPPLRDRRDDVGDFAASYLKRLQAPPVPTPAAVSALERYDWPGNLREFRLVMESAVEKAAGGVLDVAHLPPRVVRGLGIRPAAVKPVPLDELLERLERRSMQRAHSMFKGNKSKAAEHLGISRARFIRRWEQFQRESTDDREESGSSEDRDG